MYCHSPTTPRYLRDTSMSKREISAIIWTWSWIIIWQRFDSVETCIERDGVSRAASLSCEFTYRDSAKQGTRKPDRLQIALIRLPSLTTMCSTRISKCLLVATKSLSTEIRYAMLLATEIDPITRILLDIYLICILHIHYKNDITIKNGTREFM